MIEKSKILVVDDIATNLILMQKFLKSVDAIPITVASAYEALDILPQHQFALVILDIQMAEMDGISLAENIRNSEQYEKVPLLFISGVYSADKALEKGLHTGACDFMEKPVNWPLLLNKVQLFVDLDQKSKQLAQEINLKNHALDELHAEKELLQIMVESIGDGLITTDINRKITYINPVGEQMTGWTNEQASTRSLDDVFKIVYEDTQEWVNCPVKHCLVSGKLVKLTGGIQLISRADQKFSIQDSVAPIYNRDGVLTGAVLIFSDVTVTRKLTQELAYQSIHDPLTDLMNRKEFEFRLNRLVNSVKSKSSHHALFYLDIDQFKVINDSFGHSAGDILLKELSLLLNSHIRNRDSLGRLGGDEFAVVMEHCDMSQAILAAEKLRAAVSEFRFKHNGKICKVGISVGVIGINKHVKHVKDLLIQADMACFAAKREGGNQVKVYDSSDLSLSQHHDEIKWLSKIHHAIEENKFEIFYQIIQSCRDKSDIYIEILIRLRDQDGKYVPPVLFLTAAERYGIITEIDVWMIENTFKWMQKNPLCLERLSKISINLSGLSICDRSFLLLVCKLFEQYQIPEKKVCFEITETALINNFAKANHFIHVLTARGCQFALDDFGTGLCSFSYLKNLPVEYIKIDGSFVRNMLNDPIDLKLVTSINDIGHILGKKTIVEFVENQGLIDLSLNLDIDYMQGYAIARPVSIDQFSLITDE